METPMLSFTLDPQKHDWLGRSGVRAVFRAIEDAGGQALIVGGAVRDALLGRQVRDVDFAVTCPPLQVMALFEALGVKVVPLGLTHGTVLVVLDGQSYEITTLREDQKTDGRHAQVAWTDDWQADAARRDFTFNALYVAQDGQGRDYFDGCADLKARLVRFIGDPYARIEEDVLRILRAFRFWAVLDAPIEEKSLAACLAHKNLLPSLSRERVCHELLKLLEAEDPSIMCRFMLEQGVWDAFLPQARGVSRLEKLVKLEKKFQAPPNTLRRLAALWEGTASAAQQCLNLSHKQTEALAGMSKPLSYPSQETLRDALFERGASIARDAILLTATNREDPPDPPLFAAIEAWHAPVFPLRGQDLLKAGLPAGPVIGQVLREVETWWRQADFVPTQADCLAEALRVFGGLKIGS
ncbi:MAG: CCA tRNA nucleotidyltransferase [Alphaproteobacteria bacterium]|nr:CCA tRNA nucleotidyltransferase [Alphaproteobacteria bacterium]